MFKSVIDLYNAIKTTTERVYVPTPVYLKGEIRSSIKAFEFKCQTGWTVFLTVHLNIVSK